MRRTILRSTTAVATLAVGLALALPVSRADAQVGVLLQGVMDGELAKTDSASQLLARNAGRLGALGRLTLWGAAEPLRDLVVFGQASGETGPARHEPGSEVYLQQYGVRWSPSDAFVLEGGKITHTVGVFASRHLSFRNPLVGSPEGYTLAYPRGVKLSGSATALDWRAAVLSLPVSHEDYTPEPGEAPRPAVGVGVTPLTGFRVGASATAGPYLNKTLATPLLAGRDWRHYRQRVIAADAQLARGYFEAFGEIAHGSYDVPGNAAPVTGLTWYVESKYTFTPRFYLAARGERNAYPYIQPISATTWTSETSDFTDGEVGAGFRATATTLVKLSLRADHWVPNPNPFAPSANGRSIGFQISQTFDVLELASRGR